MNDPVPPTPGTALVLSYSDIAADPRVRRQIDWLAADGRTVDTLGLGAFDTPEARDNFVLGPPKPWTLTKAGAAFASLGMPGRQRFRVQVLDRVPAELRARIRRGEYDLIVFNETEFLPWVADPRDFTPAALRGRLHVDLHEFHNPVRRRNTFGGRLMSPHYRWVRSHIGHPAFGSRTVVNQPIGQIYVDEFGIPPLQEIRNIPPEEALTATPVDPERIRLVHHGAAGFERGFAEILDAMRELPARFTMTFMLTENELVLNWLREQIAAHPAGDRIEIVPPAPMREIAQRINQYDMEVIFWPPAGRNLELALPNKLFESIQARLGLVVHEGRTMAPIVREWDNGIVVSTGFTGADLAAAVAPLTAEEVTRMKAASDVAAHDLNAEVEGRRFIEAIGG